MLKEELDMLRDDETDVMEFLCGVTTDMCNKCEVLAIARDIWNWYATATDSGPYEYYKDLNTDLMPKTANVMTEYGYEQFSKAYLRGAEVLVPLLQNKDFFKDEDNKEKILSFSEKLASYLDEYEFEILELIKDYLLDNYELICEL